MNLYLVLPGSHEQFLQWLSGRTMPMLPYRPVLGEEQMRGFTARDVEMFERIGTYWENAAWGSASYRLLMAEGLRWDMSWALPWDADWAAAQARKTRGVPGQSPAERARERHERMVRRLRGQE